MKSFFKTLPLRTRLTFSTNDQKTEAAIVWMNQKGGRLKDLEAALSVPNVNQSSVAQSWLNKEERTAEDLKVVLSLVTDEQYRSEIAQSWFSKEGRTAEDFNLALPFVTGERSRFDTAKSWLSKEGRTAEDLKLALPFVTNEQYRSEIVQSWFSKEGRISEDFNLALPFVTNDWDKWSRFDTPKSWISREGRTAEDFKLALSLVTDEQYRSNIARSWFSKKGRTVEDIKLALSLVTNERSRSEIVISWLSREGRTAEDFKLVLPLVTGERYQMDVAQYWFSKEGRTAEGFKLILPLVTSERSRSEIAQYWLSREGRTSEDFKLAFPFVTNDRSRFDTAQYWLSREGRTSEDFKLALPLVTGEWYRSEIARSWFSKKGRTAEDLKLALSFVTGEEYQWGVAQSWLSKEGRTAEGFKLILPLVTSERSRSQIAQYWLSKEGRTVEDIKLALSLVTSEQYQSEIAQYWLSKEGRTSEDFKLVFPFVTDEWSRSNIAQSWLSREGRTSEDFKLALPLVTGEYCRSNIAKFWISQAPTPQEKYEHFADLAKAEIFPSADKYDVVRIANTYRELSLPTEKFPSLGVDLYPNSEAMQTRLFQEFLIYAEASSLQDIKPQLTSFIQNLHEDECALEAITAVRGKITLSPIEVLEITKNRLSNKYESVSDLLKEKNLEESLSARGLQTVRELFSNNTSPIDINLADLFSYYDTHRELVNFKSLLVPEVLQEIAASFSPSSKMAYVSNVEFGKMSDLLNNSATPESNLALPSVKIIADYLGGKVGDINRVLTSEEIVAYQFGDSATLHNAEIPNHQEYLTKKFRNLLTATNPSSAEVSEFFERALNPDLANPTTEITARNRIINEENQSKLHTFFDSNKHLLASLFQREEGLDNFAGTISSLGHGCAANIATQAKIALYQSLITDPCDQILFCAFKEKISGAILNSGGDLLTGSAQGINVFNDRTINQNFVSPNGLLTILSEEFYSNGKIKKNAVEFVEKEAGEGVRNALTESIFEHDPDTFNQEMAKIAAYIVLQKTLPDLCENKYLAQPRSEYLAIVNEWQKTVVVEDVRLTMQQEENPSTNVAAGDFSRVADSVSRANVTTS